MSCHELGEAIAQLMADLDEVADEDDFGIAKQLLIDLARDCQPGARTHATRLLQLAADLSMTEESLRGIARVVKPLLVNDARRLLRRHGRLP
ncbi:MAG: hypothetical protein A2Y57_00970 [Candidatus Woykebacteria bacterium RBG_13_40_7b]|uniref:Uncharacterized protein n=1 Tax=Candidatus Woykebacteria bacterium RBG_13_40_7b TaxID=1802594 RepID=A0A1G1WAY2_9BACT|nr:MAG: hypothetical protein A2Y57_00970 [Candidatus Woykebacteria bacterium RBG_13_40_7b]